MYIDYISHYQDDVRGQRSADWPVDLHKKKGASGVDRRGKKPGGAKAREEKHKNDAG